MSEQELLNIIEKKRLELIQLAAKKGLTSLDILKMSQELDILINEYNKFYIDKSNLSCV